MANSPRAYCWARAHHSMLITRANSFVRLIIIYRTDTYFIITNIGQRSSRHCCRIDVGRDSLIFSCRLEICCYEVAPPKKCGQQREKR